MRLRRFRIAFAGLVAAAVVGGSLPAPPAVAASREGYLQLAARDDDPAAAFFNSQARRRAKPRAAPRPRPKPKPTVPPFALPTAPIAVTPRRAEPAPEARPGGSEIPPYEEELLRLSEILGAMHYLRALCGADEGQLWRDQMEHLIAVEEPQPAWRARLVASFNEGYRGFDRTYRNCTPSAVRAIDLYISEGRELAEVIKSRYSD